MPPFAPTQRTGVDGVEIAYRRAGAGEPVLLLHGIPTSSRLWDAVGADLAADFDVIAPDLIDALGAGRVVLVGHDIGGAAAQVMAVDAPERVRALVLIDSVCFDSWPIYRMRVLRATAPPLARRFPQRWFALFGRSLYRYLPDGEPREALAASLAAWSSDAAGAEAFMRNARALDSKITQAVAPRLGEIRVPAHVVWGERDPFQKVRWAPKLRDAIPDATLVTLPGGHFLPWDLPAEVAREIRALAARE